MESDCSSPRDTESTVSSFSNGTSFGLLDLVEFVIELGSTIVLFLVLPICLKSLSLLEVFAGAGIGIGTACTAG